MLYPLGVQDFSKIIKRGALYADKTALIYDLVTQHEMVFLSRPRRFGKSLLISTLAALFSGQKALFNDLAISKTDYDFAEYPVIEFSFAGIDVTEAIDLKQYIINTTNYYAKRWHIELTLDSYEERFAELLRSLATSAVLLIDEYDKPILDNLQKPALAEIKRVMSVFYAAVKTSNRYLHFVLITGVSKFAKISVFSSMNNLTDISMNKHYAALCGITQQELEYYFKPAITVLLSQTQLAEQPLLAKIKYWYNGYRFHHLGESVYNPYSLLSLFFTHEFKNYWFSTATPTFLLELLKDKQYELKDLSQFELGESAFEVCEPENMSVQSMFVQTGYLSIKAYNPPLYRLDFPNYEVKKSFLDSLVGYYSKLNTGPGETYIVQLTQQLQANDLNAFFATLRLFFCNIPYDITLRHEKYYQSLFYAIFSLIGFSIETEVRTNQGRIDCVIQTESTIYLIEFKLDGSKEEALKQIQTKHYAQKYQASQKKVILLGVEFEQKTRNLGDFIQVLAF